MTHGHQRLAVFIRDSISVWVVEEADKIETLDQRQRSGPSHSGLEKCRYYKHSNDNKLD